MGFYEVYSHPELKRYKSTLVSKASFVQLVCIVLEYLSPFLIAYFAGGFWLKNAIYSEQPQTNYEYRYIVVLETNLNRQFFTSSFDSVNQILQANYVPSSQTVDEQDLNSDGLNDILKLSITMNFNLLASNEVINMARVFLLFNNSLTTKGYTVFESAGYVEAACNQAATQLSIGGQLNFIQSKKLQDKSTNTQYNFQYLDTNPIDLESLNLPNILNTYYQRSFGTTLQPYYTSFSSNSPSGFTVVANINYATWSILYIPAFWEQFKWGWIQYIAVLIPFHIIFKYVKIFIFENQLVQTIVLQANKLLYTKDF